MEIRSALDLRQKYTELSKICRETGEPVYITVNGRGDTALINIDELDNLYARLDLLSKLSLGISDIESGRTLSHEDVFKRFRNA